MDMKKRFWTVGKTDWYVSILYCKFIFCLCCRNWYSKLSVIRKIPLIRTKTEFPSNGPILIQKAQSFAEIFGHTDFQGSNGWLRKFDQRHRITYKQACGEEAAANMDTIQKWKDDNLPKLLTDYTPSNVINAAEVGLFYKCTPCKTYALKNEQCKGEKSSKERSTRLSFRGQNMDGSEKFPMLIMGKSKKSRCFKEVGSFAVEYTNNTKTWMTGKIFEDWFCKLNVKFMKQNKKLFHVLEKNSHLRQ